jgi:hypothetical protein
MLLTIQTLIIKIYMNTKTKEEKLWDYLVKTLSHLNDNNLTARKIYNKIESLSPILFR